MKKTLMTSLALASHNLAFDFGAFLHDIVEKFNPSNSIASLNSNLPTSINGTLIPMSHNYASNVFSQLTDTISGGSDGTKPINQTEFDLISAIMNTIVVVDFNRKKLLPLELADGELPTNPQSFNKVAIRMKQPTVTRVEQMKYYAAAATCNEPSLMEWNCGENCEILTKGTRVVKYLTNESAKTAGFVAVNEREKLIVVSFRGSSNLNNWINNAMITLVPFDLAEIKHSTIENKPLVHRGFQIMARSLYSQTRDALEPLLTQHKDYKVIVTGHSAGGAIATLTATAIGGSELVPFKKLTLITFGQPRVGDAAFASYLNSQPLTAARVTNRFDFVNILPTQEMGFHHQHNEFFLTRTNGVDKPKLCSAKSHTEDPECARFDVLPKRTDAHYEYFGKFRTDC